MITLKGDQVVPSVLSVYNRVKQYRPHLTEADRFVLVQKKVLKDYGLKVTNEDLAKIVEVQENLRPAVPVKKKFDFGTHNEWCPKKVVTERVAVLQNGCDKNPANHFIFRGNSLASNKCSSLPKPHLSAPTCSRFIKTATKRLQNNNNDKDKDKVNIYDRLYESRVKPCPKKVEFVQKLRESCTPKPKPSTKRPQTRHCTAQQPNSKRGRYSKECLDGSLNSCVFERLYGERKQLNYKKMTDVQKREVHLRRQREEFRKVQMARSMASACQCSGCLHESSTSDYHESASEISDITIDSTLVNANDSGLAGYNSIMFGDNDMMNSTATAEAEYEAGRVQNLLESLAERFHESMSLCVIDDPDLV